MASRDGSPANEVRGQAPLARDSHRALDCDPGHQARVDEVLLPAADLPDPLVGLIPVVTDPLDDVTEVGPRIGIHRLAVLVVEVHGVHQLTVDVELELVGGAVSDANRMRAAVTLEVVENLLFQVRPAVDPVHDLEWPRGSFAAVAEALRQPAHERLRLVREAEAE